MHSSTEQKIKNGTLICRFWDNDKDVVYFIDVVLNGQRYELWEKKFKFFQLVYSEKTLLPSYWNNSFNNNMKFYKLL